MEKEKIFSELAAHFTEGLMVHNELSTYFYYLSLIGYAKMHECHYYEESKNLFKVNQFYIDNCGKIPKDESIIQHKVIPEDWEFESNDSITTPERAVKKGMECWVDWEQSTLEFLNHIYSELIINGSSGEAIFVSNFIKDVQEELAAARHELLQLTHINFDMSYIVEDSKQKEKFYSKKLKQFCGEEEK